MLSTKAHLPSKVGNDDCFQKGLARATSFNVKYLVSFVSGAKPGGIVMTNIILGINQLNVLHKYVPIVPMK